MSTFYQGIRRFIREEDAPTAVEYAVMLALIIVVCIAAITVIGTEADATFDTVGTKLGAANGAAAS